MSMSMRALWLLASVGLLCGLLSLWELVHLERAYHEMVVSDTVAVPASVARGGGSTAGIGPSNDRQEIGFWLARFDSRAQTRMTLRNDGAQMLEFSDRAGRLRLRISIDASGAGEIRFIDADGKVHLVKPSE